jgi:hypothetical protein
MKNTGTKTKNIVLLKIFFLYAILIITYTSWIPEIYHEGGVIPKST